MIIGDLRTFVEHALFRTEAMTLFIVRGIIECYDKTRRSKPSNFNQIINNNAANHYFAEAREKKDGHFGSIISLVFGMSF